MLAFRHALRRQPKRPKRKLATLSASGKGGGEAKFEIEQKFQMPPDLFERVLAEGGVEIGSVEFADTYFDTSLNALAEQDCWLRRRDALGPAEPGQEPKIMDESWELKVPRGGERKKSGGETTEFREYLGIEAVATALAELGFTVDQPSKAFEAALKGAGIEPFADFKTRRSKLELDGVSVDADQASFGLEVMELEVLCDSDAEIPDARARIDAVATKIGALPLPPNTGGKLETYVRRFCPKVLARLIETGVLE